MPAPLYTGYVGIDWGSERHQVCVLDGTGTPLGERAFEHSGPGLAALADWLLTVTGAPPAHLAVALEVPRGAVVETLVERGFAVFALNPKQLDRFRDRYTVAGAKDDRRDARVLGDALRTDRPAFRPVRPDDPHLVELRELSRLGDDLQEELRRLANRLRDQLLRFHPQLLQLCPAADEPWLWTLLSHAPTPAQGQRLSLRAVARLLQTHRIRRLTPDAVRTALQCPPLSVQPGTVAAAVTHIGLLLPRLRLVHAQRRQLERRIAAALDAVGTAEGVEGPRPEPRDVEILRSLPGIGNLVAATLLGEAAQPLATRDYATVRALAGAAPVTKQSGKHRVVAMRYACHQRLRQAIYHWARVSVQCDERSQWHYRALRARGHNHARALRGVADRLLSLLIAMLKTGTLYDPARRRAVTQTA